MTPRPLSKIDTIVVHTSATEPSINVGASEIRDWHMSKGWDDIGYNYVLPRYGGIELGRTLEVVPAHAGGFNTRSIGICMVGGVRRESSKLVAEDNYTDAQYANLGELVFALEVAFPQIQYICGHRDLSPDADGDGVIEKWEWKKDCPCFDVWTWYNCVPERRLRFLTPDLF